MDIFWKAVVLTIIGMGVVYLCLIVLMWEMQVLTWWFRPRLAAAPAETPAVPGEEKEPGLEVVLAAAAAHFLAMERPPLYVPPVTRRSTRWAARGRAGTPLRRSR